MHSHAIYRLAKWLRAGQPQTGRVLRRASDLEKSEFVGIEPIYSIKVTLMYFLIESYLVFF